MHNPDPLPAKGAPLRVLMIAFHFPPLAGSSGIQRTLRFVQHLPSFGWQPLVLSAHPRAFTSVSADLMGEVPPGTIVERPFALDTARHLAISGRYPGRLALPDRWCTWSLGAIPTGLMMIRKYRPDVIWSTYPIATAHLIAQRLHRLSGVPWIADFRDPMVQDGYPEDPRAWRSFRRVEQRAVSDAARIVFVTPGAKAMYHERYAAVPTDRFAVIENGYDEESFVTAERDVAAAPLNPGCFTLLHSGIVYPLERDPRALFEALGRLKAAGAECTRHLRIRFRSPVHADLLAKLASESRTEDLVEILPSIPYRDALQEMLRADGLMVMQGANCNEQIPAKVYEYLRARRPILGLADPKGDTAKTMLAAGVRHVATLEDSPGVEDAMQRFLAEFPVGVAPRPMGSALAAMSRSSRAHELVGLLDRARQHTKVRG